MTQWVDERPRTGPKPAVERAEFFSLRGLPLLSDGAATHPLLRATNLDVTGKVYSSGGENDLHSHDDQDHAFFVLQGSATFYDEHGGTTDVQSLEGVMIPRGVKYRFLSTGDENLVMLRTAGWSEKNLPLRETHLGPNGIALEGKDPRTGGSRGRVATETGEKFAPDGSYLS